MLFSSIEFLFFFLPIVLIGYLLLRKTTGQKYIYIWLSVTSLFFYCWWDIALSWLIFCSLGFNFLLGRQLIQQTNLQRNTRKLLTIAGDNRQSNASFLLQILVVIPREYRCYYWRRFDLEQYYSTPRNIVFYLSANHIYY